MGILTFTNESAYIKILFIYSILWVLQMIACHFTHSLILLTDSYVMLYKIMEVALRVMMFQIKTELSRGKSNCSKTWTGDLRLVAKFGRNCTYQMLRLPILGSLINSLFVVALALSIIIEGIQSFVHSGHENNGNSLLDYNSVEYRIILIVFSLAHILIQVLSMLIKDTEVINSLGSKSSSQSLTDLEVVSSEVQDEQLSGIKWNQSSRDRAVKDKTGSNVTLTSVKSLNNNNTTLVNNQQGSIKPETINTISGKVSSEVSYKLHRNMILEASQLRHSRLCDFLRDFSSPIAVLTCAIVLLIFQGNLVSQVSDAVGAIVAVALLCYSLYPSIKRSCLVILQIMPEDLNIEELRHHLYRQFPFILTIHDLHIWCLSKHKTVATCHIILREKPKDETTAQSQLASIRRSFKQFRLDYVTIQLEYNVGRHMEHLLDNSSITNDKDMTTEREDQEGECLLGCCKLSGLQRTVDISHANHHGHCHPF